MVLYDKPLLRNLTKFNLRFL